MAQWVWGYLLVGLAVGSVDLCFPRGFVEGGFWAQERRGNPFWTRALAIVIACMLVWPMVVANWLLLAIISTHGKR